MSQRDNKCQVFTKCLALQRALESTIIINGRITGTTGRAGLCCRAPRFWTFHDFKATECMHTWLSWEMANWHFCLAFTEPNPSPLDTRRKWTSKGLWIEGSSSSCCVLFRDAMLVLKSQTLWLSLLRAGISDQHTLLRRPFPPSLHHEHHTTDLKGICFCLLLNEFGLVLMKGGHRSRGELCIFLWEFF